jgi:S-adenosyl-L-methionine hydrolase (adenosine-forming)
MPAIVALLSDFGSEDHYVGAMKGAVLAACPGATLVDVVHDLPAHDVMAGALALESVFRVFPGGTVFLAVVDPGVGSARRGLAATAGGYHFVGPDNGILSLALGSLADPHIRMLTNAGLFRFEVSPVFHGRDVFAPVAGHLARGMPFEEVGPLVQDVATLRVPPPDRRAPVEWEAVVLHVDRFGNLTTNVTERDLTAMGDLLPRGLSDLQVSVEGVVLPFARTYSDVARGEPCAVLGSSGRLEIAVNQGSASRQLGARIGAPVRLFFPEWSTTEPAGEVVV